MAEAAGEAALEALAREADTLKARLEDERQKLNDVTLFAVGERLEPAALGGLKLRRVLKGHQAKVLCVQWSGDKRRVVSSAQDGRLLVWDAFTAQREHSVATAGAWLLACAWAPPADSRLLAAAGLDNKATAYALPDDDSTAVRKRTVATHAAYVACVAFARCARQLLTGAGDGQCALWDVESGTLLHAYTAHAADVLAVHAAPAADAFVSAGADRQLLVWDLRSPRPARAFASHGSDVTSARYHPGGDAVLTGCDDAACRLFDLRADREVARYSKPSVIFGVSSVDWSASGRLVFAAYGDHTAAAWDALRGTRLAVLCGHEHRVSSLATSPDGAALATASWDTTLRVWA